MNVQTGCTGYVHIAAMRKMENDGCYSLLNESYRCYETEFRSLEAPPQSLSFCHHTSEALARWQ